MNENVALSTKNAHKENTQLKSQYYYDRIENGSLRWKSERKRQSWLKCPFFVREWRTNCSLREHFQWYQFGSDHVECCWLQSDISKNDLVTKRLIERQSLLRGQLGLFPSTLFKDSCPYLSVIYLARILTINYLRDSITEPSSLGDGSYFVDIFFSLLNYSSDL